MIADSSQPVARATMVNLHADPSPTPPSHKEKWAYRYLYSQRIFALTSTIYPALGRGFCQAFSRLVARLYFSTQPEVVETVRCNLEVLRGSASRSEAEEVFSKFSRCISDYVGVGSLPEDQLAFLNGGFEGHEYFESLQPGQGAILATAHYSFFEFGAVVLARRGLRISIGTLPEPDDSLSRWRAAWRERWGIGTVEVGADPFSALGLRRAVDAGRLAAVLADRPQPGQGIPVRTPFGQVSFSKSPAVLSLLCHAPVLPVIIRSNAAGGYDLVALKPQRCEPSSPDQRAAEIERCTRAIGESLLTEIRKDVTEWFQFVPVT